MAWSVERDASGAPVRLWWSRQEPPCPHLRVTGWEAEGSAYVRRCRACGAVVERYGAQGQGA